MVRCSRRPLSRCRAAGAGRDYAFIAAGLTAARAFSSDRFWPVAGHLLPSLTDLAAGVVVLVCPVPSALVLTLIADVWAIAGDVAEFAAGFAVGESASTRAMFLLGGLVSVASGALQAARPGIGAVTLALLFGLFVAVYGVPDHPGQPAAPGWRYPALGTARRRLTAAGCGPS